MAAPSAPTKLHPADGAALVDHKAPLLLQKGPLVDADFTLGTARLAAQNLVASQATGMEWTAPAKLLSFDGTQADMATSTSIGACNIADFSGGSFGVTTTLQVKDITFELASCHTWPSTAGDPGDGWVRLLLTHSGRYRDQTAVANGIYAGGTATAPIYRSKSFQSVFEDILGTAYTVADLEGLGTDLRLYVITWEGLKTYITNWYAAGLKMRIEYYATGPDTQSAYEFKITTDSAGASAVYDTGKTEGATDYHVVPPDTLSGDTTYYWWPQVWDSSDNASGYPSSGNEFTTVGDGAAQLIHDPSAELVMLAEIEFGKYLEAGLWTKTAADADGNPTADVYECSFVRSSEKTPNFWIVDFEEEGLRKNYTEVYSIADVEATASTFFWDEGSVDKLYVHTSDGRNPGAFKALGLTAALAYPIATQAITSGPGDRYFYEPRLLQAPAITDSIEDLVTARGSTPSGALVVANADGLFYDLLAHETDEVTGHWLRADAGWLSNMRRVRLRMVGTTRWGRVPYAEALDVFDGVVTWPKGEVLQGAVVRFAIQSRKALIKDTRLAVEKYSKEQYPNLLEREEGQPIPELFGAFHKRAKLTVVNTDSPRLLRPGLSVSRIYKVYCNGVLVPETIGGITVWSYDTTTNHITLAAATFDARFPDLWPDAEFTCDPNGESYEASARQYPGKLARLLLERRIPSGDIVTASFNSIDTHSLNVSDQSGDKYELRFIADRESAVVDHIRVVETSGTFHVVYRQDGKVVAVSGFPAQCEANTSFLFDHDILSEPRYSFLANHMGFAAIATYWGYLNPDEPIAETVAHTWLTKAQHGIDEETRLETYHSSREGAAVRAGGSQSLLRVPHKHITFTTGLRAWLSYPGSTVALTLDEALDADAEFSWALCQVMRRALNSDGTVEMELRYRRALPAMGRPF